MLRARCFKNCIIYCSYKENNGSYTLNRFATEMVLAAETLPLNEIPRQKCTRCVRTVFSVRNYVLHLNAALTILFGRKQSMDKAIIFS